MNEIVSLSAEHIVQEGKKIPLCSRVARKNLGILLGFREEELHDFSLYSKLDFAPIGSAVQVHNDYKNGWKSPNMIGEYLYMKEYGENIWCPPRDALYADLFFGTPSGHRCVAFKKQEEWYILDPYFHSKDVAPLCMSVPFETYRAFLYYIRGAILEGVSFYHGKLN